jgi:hypothetical protein
VVAVARKLAVVLHRLWTTGEADDPLRRVSLSRGAGHRLTVNTIGGSVREVSDVS